jgi:hypothetical protein
MKIYYEMILPAMIGILMGVAFLAIVIFIGFLLSGRHGKK